MSHVTYTSAPLDFEVSPIAFDAGGPTTMIGATVSVDAISQPAGVKYHGAAVVTGAAAVRCTFAAGALPAGRYEVQLLATIGGLAQVISASLWTVKQGAG